MMLKGFELLYAYLDQNTIRWAEPDESVYNAISCVEKELKRTKRALWLARADKALMVLEYFTMKCRWFKDFMKIEPPKCDVSMIKKWACVSRKCRAYADKFKEETK